MDFDFLPNLPKSDLDDRTFEDLVEECLLRIPRYCPEWTNYNPSDPGITVVELFAWLTDQMLLRFNQVPRRNYVAFLELLGIRLDPPQPARTDLTFYLSSARSQNLVIEAGTEVATQRQDAEEPITFSTDSDWVIGTPQIASLLTATILEDKPSPNSLSNVFVEDRWQRNDRNQWFLEGEQSSEVFKSQPQPQPQSQPQSPSQWQTQSQTQYRAPQPGNCFYLVLASQPIEGGDGDAGENGDEGEVEGQANGQKNAIAGNVIAITFEGEEAATTGIDPNHPPRRWEVWNGKAWVSKDILRRESDDRTKGFSFERTADSPNPEQGVDVILHLPIELPEADFGTNHRGYWLRCVYADPKGDAYGYDRSPQISKVSVRSIGSTVPASHCTWIKDEEFLGVSNGKPGQTFELLNKPILPRDRREYIQVRSPMFEHSRQTWQEVENFSASGQDSPHYTIDSNRGIVQFGPLIREPKGLQQNTQQRYGQQEAFQSQLELWKNRQNRSPYLPASELDDGVGLQGQQYGKIPPKGWEIYMVAYRTGGGEKGNVKPQTLEKLMISQPYIRSVINYKKADGGLDEQSLEQAVMKVPGWLRTSDRAVTREDFETLTKRLGGGRVARTRCLEPEPQNPGQVKVLVIPNIELEPTFDLSLGMNADTFKLKNKDELEIQLQDRALLGTRIQVSEPNYIRIGVRLILGIDPRGRDTEKTVKAVKSALYQFLHPVFGGLEGKGWEFDRAVRAADISTCCQKVSGVNYIENVQLFRIQTDTINFDYPDWQAGNTIYLNPDEMVYSWDNRDDFKKAQGYSIQNFNGSIQVTIDI